jgi:hypothetical protein
MKQKRESLSKMLLGIKSGDKSEEETIHLLGLSHSPFVF